MRIIPFIKKYPEYILFFFTFFARYIIIFSLLKPLEYLQQMPKQYDIRAVDFAMGGAIFNPEQWSYYYIPLGLFYQVLQATGLLSDRIIAVVVLQLIIGALSIVLFFKTAKLFVSFKTAFILSIIGALYYPLIYFNALNISETFYILLILAALYILLKQQALRVRTAIILGILLGLAYIIKPLLFFFFPLLLIWILVSNQAFKRKMKLAIAIFIPVILIVFTTALINMGVSTHKEFVLSASGGANFAMTQCHIKRLEYYTVKKETAWFAPPLYWNTDYQEVLTTQPFRNTPYYINMGLDCIKKEPTKFVSNLTNLPNIFFGPFYPDFTEAPWHKALIQIANIINFILFLLFVGYLFLIKEKKLKNRIIVVYLLIAGVFFSIFLANPGESRYGHTHFLLFLLFGYLAFMLLLKRLTKGKR